MSEVEETIRRLSSKKNVQGVVVVNQLGLMIRSTLDASLGKQYATLMSDLIRMARQSVTQLDAQNELTFLRIRTKMHEIMICPALAKNSCTARDVPSSILTCSQLFATIQTNSYFHQFSPKRSNRSIMPSTRQLRSRAIDVVTPSVADHTPQTGHDQTRSKIRSQTRVRNTSTNQSMKANEEIEERDDEYRLPNDDDHQNSLSNSEAPQAQRSIPTKQHSHKKTPLTARGARRLTATSVRRSNRGKRISMRADVDILPDNDSVEEVEEPRRQRVYAVEIVERAFKAKIAMREQQGDVSEDKEVSSSVSWALDTSKESVKPSTASSTAALAVPFTAETVNTDAQTSAVEALQDVETSDLSLSKMSLSPPPSPSFGFDDEEYGSPWLMVYDSNPTAQYRRRTLQANWTIEDLERELQEDNPNPDPNPDSDDEPRLEQNGWWRSQSSTASPSSARSLARRKSGELKGGAASPTKGANTSTLHGQLLDRDNSGFAGWPQGALMDSDTGVEVDYGEAEDDPFGFAKVERQLQRAKSMRPRLVAINNRNHKDWEWDILHSNKKSSTRRQSEAGDDDTGVFNFTVESSPRKIPEAGMPTSLDFSSSKTSGGRSRAKKYMRTEHLEAMLPRRRKVIASKKRTTMGAGSWTVSSTHEQESETESVALSDADDESDEEVLVRRRPVTASTSNSRVPKKRRSEKELQTPTSNRSRVAPVADTTNSREKTKAKAKTAEMERTDEEDSSGWTTEQLAAHEERIKYFKQVDDFEMEVETVR
ncbi:Ddynein light chain roadblock-type 1 [Mortierella sp. GBA30]|nr:Ddynein light chain roadblock-type 1 [Mortierella sp. GBA30]